MDLVVGATGMTGSFLLYYLLEKNEKVVATCRNKKNVENTYKIFSYLSESPQLLFKRIIWVEADISNYTSLLSAFSGIESVYHTAALVSFHPKDKEIIKQINIEGTANVVNACLETKIKKLAYVSSIAALGIADDEENIDENAKPQPNIKATAYSASKLHAELEVWRGIHEGLNAVIVNPSVIIGGGDWSKGSPAMFRTVWNGLRFYTYGKTGFVDVRDVAKCLIELCQSNISGERFILNSENIQYKNIFNWMADILHKKRPNIYASPFLSNMAWRMEALKYFFTRIPPLLTRETANSAHNSSGYVNKKIVETLHYKFIPIQDSIRFFGEKFLKERHMSNEL